MVCAGNANAAEFDISPSIQTFYTSNVFLDRSEEWDVGIQPGLGLGVDFGEVWSFGYTGSVDIFIEHTDLLAGWNQLSLMANPAWGPEDENEFYFQLSAEALNNTSAYSDIDYISPAISLGVILEPTAWFRWKFTNREFFRLFYHDRPADGLDSWTGTEFTFTLPSRTTISPRFIYGMRFYTDPDRTMKNDRFDHQLEPGVHLSQGLWETGGLQADYAYRYVIGSNALFVRNFTQTQFTYLGEDFLFSGHRVSMKFTQVLPKGFKLAAGVEYQTRDYNDWPAVDPDGRETGESRYDQRLTPSFDIEYRWSRPEGQGNSAIPDVKVAVRYSYTREWSNSYYYDTSWHLAALDFSLNW
jgi:hypothetical protein